jgi:hypothetical protein
MKIENPKTTRKIICKGLGKTYTVDAYSYTDAKRQAAKMYREETGDNRPIDLLTFFIRTNAEELKPMGRPLLAR